MLKGVTFFFTTNLKHCKSVRSNLLCPLHAMKGKKGVNSIQKSDIKPDNPESDFDCNMLSHDSRLNRLLQTVLREVRFYAEDQIKHIRQGAEIGKALSVEKNINKLLEMIVDEARAMSKADAGTLYLLAKDKKHLRVEILQNESMKVRINGMTTAELNLPNVPLYSKDGEENHSHVSAHVALTGEIVNIPDVYKAEGFDFSGTRTYDAKTGYRSKSMLVIPLKNYENKIIGVLQILNAQDPETREVIAFPRDYVDLIASLASQAAVSLTNTQLIQDLKDQIKRIKRAAEIGKALSVGDNIDRLLEMIVDEARDMSGADAGTLYMVDKNNNLQFKVLQNDSMGIKVAGMDSVDRRLPDAPFTLPSVPLYTPDGEENYANVSSYVALKGEAVNIRDVYEFDEARGFDFTGPQKYDASTGYRSRSMLVMPLKNHENDVIGVLQLLNAQNEAHEVVPFSEEYVDLIESLASQAAVAMTNAQLIRDVKELFYSLIESIARAVDAKSHYTHDHVSRVVDLTMMIAERINEAEAGPFKDVRFSEDELEELRLAAWMHDVGKIATPEHVIDKSTKLETIADRIALVQTRFELIAEMMKNECLQRKIRMLEEGNHNPRAAERLEKQLAEELAALKDDLEFIKRCNQAGEFMKDEYIERIKTVGAKTYISPDGEQRLYLTEDEIVNLCIRKGTLTAEERKIIENHASMTYRILCALPFPPSLRSVPDYAAAHHERPDGSGYPLGISGDDLWIQARIMAVADVFEALTARDRPYKKPMKLSQAVKILSFMKKDGHIDPNIFDLFIESGIYRAYAAKELAPDQIDE